MLISACILMFDGRVPDAFVPHVLTLNWALLSFLCRRINLTPAKKQAMIAIMV